MVVSPGKVADCDIYFRSMGYAPQIVGVDLFKPDNHRYLGWVYPANIDMEVKRAMLEFIKKHKRDWVRVHHSAPSGMKRA
jgi:hypothetical protein